ncbi:MAG: DUF294 nucleotidyltransferase-like domain-containing protein, partial [Ignavibacteriaceae bacterium]|jgi:CBS domain-containing protein|nr:DUF294 nucleotidyltransferase-like domain-containing protein [Ignavibacteriaceae bacterium]
MWQWKDDAEHIVPKLSYVSEFKPWGWIIGTGIYIEDVKAEISALTGRFTLISAIITVIIALILLYSGRQSFNIERKRIAAEAELKRSREKYRSLVEASTDGLIMLADKRIIFVNPIFESLYGKNAAEIGALNISDIFEIPAELLSFINQSDYSFGQKSFECKLATADDKSIDTLVSVNAVQFYDRSALVFSVKDLGKDKLAIEESILNKEKFQSLMDKLNQGIFRTSLDNRGKFLDGNKTALQILGYKNATELEGLHILDFFAEKEDKLNFRNELIQTGFIRNRILKLRKRSGEQIFVSVSVVVVSDKSGPKYCDGIIQDVKLSELSNSGSDDAFSGFMQSLLRPTSSIALKPVFVPYDTEISAVAAKMNASNVSVVLLTGPAKEILGYISDESIRNRLFSKNGEARLKAFEIMSSPLTTISENESIFMIPGIIAKNPDTPIFTINDVDVPTGFITASSLNTLNDLLPLRLMGEISEATSAEELKEIYRGFVTSLLPLIELNTQPNVIFSALAELSQSLSRRVIEFGIAEFGEPPVAFSFISLGSEGRHEQTLNTDQDNAIIYADTDNPVAKEYFAALSEFVCTALDKIGYSFCKGGIMAMNPVYCQPMQVWKQYLSKWINNGNAKDLLDISVFFDFRLTYGEDSFVSELRTYINLLTSRNPAYLFLLAQNNLRHKPQVGFWGNILPDSALTPPDSVNIKEAIMPIVNFARIYALQHQLAVVGTRERLKVLFRENHLSEQSYQNVSQTFNVLQMMRLSHQAVLVKNGLKADNFVNTKRMSELDQAIIKKLLANINGMHSKLSYDFKGTM